MHARRSSKPDAGGRTRGRAISERPDVPRASHRDHRQGDHTEVDLDEYQGKQYFARFGSRSPGGWLTRSPRPWLAEAAPTPW